MISVSIFEGCVHVEMINCLVVIQSSHSLIDIQLCWERCHSDDSCCQVASNAHFVFKSHRKFFVQLCRSFWKISTYRTFLRCNPFSKLCLPPDCLDQMLFIAKKWCERIFWQAEWRSVQLSGAKLLLRRIQSQIYLERVCNEGQMLLKRLLRRYFKSGTFKLKDHKPHEGKINTVTDSHCNLQ